MKHIFLDQFSQCFHHFCITVLIIRTHEQKSLCPKGKKKTIQKLNTHLIHPLNIVKEQHDFIFFQNFSKHVKNCLFDNLIIQSSRMILFFNDLPFKENFHLPSFIFCQYIQHQTTVCPLIYFPENITPGTQKKFFFFLITSCIKRCHLITADHLLCLIQKCRFAHPIFSADCHTLGLAALTGSG